MKKTIVVILISLAALASGFIPVTKSDTFKINAPYDNVYQQFTSPKNWVNWQPDLKKISKSNTIKIDSSKTGFQITAPSIAVNLQNLGLGNFVVTQTQNNKLYNYSCILTPESTSNKTLATIISEIHLFGYISSFIIKDDKQPPIAGLKSYLEDTRLYYGFMIRKELTTEKLIAVKRGSFINSGLYQQTGKMLNQLKGYLLKNKLKIVSPLQLQYVTITKDSVQVMLGFPVDKKAATANDIEYMAMPKGKILVGYFNDYYKNKEKLYNAMRQYMRGNYIHPMIQPFERFDNNKLPAGDSSLVNMQLIVPYM